MTPTTRRFNRARLRLETFEDRIAPAAVFLDAPPAPAIVALGSSDRSVGPEKAGEPGPFARHVDHHLEADLKSHGNGFARWLHDDSGNAAIPVAHPGSADDFAEYEAGPRERPAGRAQPFDVRDDRLEPADS